MTPARLFARTAPIADAFAQMRRVLDDHGAACVCAACTALEDGAAALDALEGALISEGERDNGEEDVDDAD